MRSPVKHPRMLIPDQQYSSILVSRLINSVMKDGKKAVASRIVYNALDRAAKEAKKEPLAVLDTAIANAAPSMELKSRRVGGANYQVPSEVRPERRVQLALRWMVGAARAGKGRDMEEKLAEEFLNASKNEGTAVKKKQEMHRMAEANRAFAHFAWGRRK